MRLARLRNLPPPYSTPTLFPTPSHSSYIFSLSGPASKKYTTPASTLILSRTSTLITVPLSAIPPSSSSSSSSSPASYEIVLPDASRYTIPSSSLLLLPLPLHPTPVLNLCLEITPSSIPSFTPGSEYHTAVLSYLYSMLSPPKGTPLLLPTPCSFSLPDPFTSSTSSTSSTTSSRSLVFHLTSSSSTVTLVSITPTTVLSLTASPPPPPPTPPHHPHPPPPPHS